MNVVCIGMTKKIVVYNVFHQEVEADNTLVVVLGCEATELRQLLSFMYTGEMTASRRTLPALLRLARTLRVYGLTDVDCTVSVSVS